MAEAFWPSVYLKDEMLARVGDNRRLFASVCGIRLIRFDAILDGDERLTMEDAKSIAAGLGTSVDLWLNLQAAWDAQLAHNDGPGRAGE